MLECSTIELPVLHAHAQTQLHITDILTRLGMPGYHLLHKIYPDF